MNKLMKDKKGFMGIVIFFLILFTILILGFIAVMATSIIDLASDEITPVMKELGVVGDSNMSEVAEYTFGVTDSFVQAMPWLIAFLYLGALVFSVVFAISYNFNPNPAFIGIYIAFILLLILGSIVMSNMYEDIYSGTDEIATRLQDQTAMSYLLLYSPFILTLIAFITGIYLFVGKKEEGGYPV